MISDPEFGEGKRKELEFLRGLYAELGKPFNYVQLGRENSRTELKHLKRQARGELAARRNGTVSDPVQVKRLLSLVDDSSRKGLSREEMRELLKREGFQLTEPELGSLLRAVEK